MNIDKGRLAGWNHYYAISQQGNSPQHNEAKYAVRNQWRHILEMVNALDAENEQMLQALRHYAKLYWPHNAAVTDDIEALRRACREHCDWWNNIALPLLDDDCPICGEDHEGHPPLTCKTGDGV